MPLCRRSFGCVALSLALSAASVPSAHAQDLGAAPAQATLAPSSAQLDEILSSLNRARFIGQVAVSPDGKRLAWLEAGQIRVAPIGNLGQSQLVTAASPGQSCGASDLIWSPGSAFLAFLSDCDNPGEQPDLFLSSLDGNPARRIGNLSGYAGAPAFSPDGKFIAFLYVAGASRPADALAAQALPSGVIGEDHVEVQRVAMVPADASQPAVPSFATPANLHVFEFDWSPDSRALAYVAADPPGEDNWWVAKLYTQSVCAQTITAGGAPGLASETWDRTKPGAPGPSPLGTGDSAAPTSTTTAVAPSTTTSGAPGPGSPRTGLRPGVEVSLLRPGIGPSRVPPVPRLWGPGIARRPHPLQLRLPHPPQPRVPPVSLLRPGIGPSRVPPVPRLWGPGIARRSHPLQLRLPHPPQPRVPHPICPSAQTADV